MDISRLIDYLKFFTSVTIILNNHGVFNRKLKDFSDSWKSYIMRKWTVVHLAYPQTPRSKNKLNSSEVSDEYMQDTHIDTFVADWISLHGVYSALCSHSYGKLAVPDVPWSVEGYREIRYT